MATTPKPITLPPGIVNDNTDYAIRGRYTDGNMVRFWKGAPERWLGWQRIGTQDMDGPPRGAIEWINRAGIKLMAWGTANKLWLMVNSATLYDITPAGLPSGLVDTIDTIDVPNPGEFGSGVSPLVAANGGRARTWMLDTWGQDLIATPRGGTVYQWAGDNPYGTPATPIAGAPATCLGAFVDADSRHLVVIGAHTGLVDDPLLVRWPDQETLVDWTPMSTNTAGDERLTGGNECVGVVQVAGAKLMFTDTAVYVFRYVGGDDIFDITREDVGAGLIGPHAATSLDGMGYWMSSDGFYSYNGAVQGLDCDVHNYVFENLNRLQAHKVCAGTNRKFRERIWFYPHGDSTENNRFVAFNDDGWSVGELAQTSWIDTGVVVTSPVGTTPSGRILRHNTGTMAEGENIAYRLTTGDITEDVASIAGGLGVQMSRAMIPDFARISGSHSVTVKTKHYPNGPVKSKGPYPYSSATKQFSTRSRGAIHQLVFSGTGDFRMGGIRIITSANGGRG